MGKILLTSAMDVSLIFDHVSSLTNVATDIFPLLFQNARIPFVSEIEWNEMRDHLIYVL